MEIAMIEAQPLSPARYATEYASDPDLPLVEASINGNISAFEELVRRHSQSLLRIADQVVHNLDDAQEAVQEAFLKAYQSLRQFRRTSRFSTWLTRIALNESIGLLRKRRTQEISLEYRDPRADNSPLQIADWHPDPECLYGQVELRRILRTALLGLRPSLRVVFVLRDVEGLSVAETAAILDLTTSTVKVRLHRARLQLRDILSRYFRQSTAGLPFATGIHSRPIQPSAGNDKSNA
jgi:RNA polymerase sigma-70 factor, ECF subfamily